MSTDQANGKAEIATNASNGATAASADMSKVPDWFTGKIFETILKENIPEYEKIVNFKAYPALAPGENYVTMMLRAEIDVKLQDGTAKSLSYMCKVPVECEILKDMMENHNVFDIEYKMYHEVIPEFEQLYHDVGAVVKFGAKYHKLPIETDHICLEDLRPRGFKNANRLEGLDLDHIHCVLRKLAQWHAASAVRVATKGQYDEALVKGFFREEEKPKFQQFNESLMKTFRQFLPTFEGHEQYLESVDSLYANYTDVLFRAASIEPTEFNVLNHGDLWCNNIMFQYDATGKIEETYFVDYQIPKYGSPAQDLLYFLISSTKLELKLKRFEYFIKFYHDHLIENLKLLRYSKALPILKEIHAQLYKYGIWGLNTIIGVMAAVLLDPTNKASLNNFLSDSADGSDFKTLMYSNPRYRKHVEVILPWLHNRGALEC